LLGRQSYCAIEGAYEVLGVFDKLENNIGTVKAIEVNNKECRLLSPFGAGP